ncbi:MAG: tetratricopeptide repeat protein [Firmicutes bacterium]|nr:tetratricopeptide repeat protein [Bacillota bacterium]
MRDIADIYTKLGCFEYETGYYDGALYSFLLSHELLEFLHDHEAQRASLYNIAITYHFGMNDYETALMYYDRLEKLFEQAKNEKDDFINMLRMKSSALESLGRYVEATESLEKIGTL